MLAGQAQIKMDDNGILQVSGILNVDTVSIIYKKYIKLIKKNQAIHVNLSAVNKSDSACLALIVEWSKYAQKQKQAFFVANIPQQIRSLATLVYLDEWLPLEEMQ